MAYHCRDSHNYLRKLLFFTFYYVSPLLTAKGKRGDYPKSIFEFNFVEFENFKLVRNTCNILVMNLRQRSMSVYTPTMLT